MMQNATGKLLEKIIAYKFTCHLESRRLESISVTKRHDLVHKSLLVMSLKDSMLVRRYMQLQRT